MNKNMGQRLVITLHEHGELGNAFAALYYHWSGFSTYSFCEATPIAKIVSSYDGSKKKLVNKILDYIESKGGGLDGGQEKYLNKHRWFNPGRVFNGDPNRNEGLLGLSPESITDMLNWAEALMKIDVDNKTFMADVVFPVDGYLEKEDPEWDAQMKRDCVDLPDFVTQPLPIKEIPIIFNLLSSADGYARINGEYYDRIE